MTQISSQDGSPIILESQSVQTNLKGRLFDYLVLTKPRITTMVLVTAYVGFAMAGASMPAANWSWLTLLGALVGTGLSCMGASALNQLAETYTDSLMDRTKQRPLPDGRITAIEALGVGLLTSLLGVMVLWTLTNGLAALLSASTIISYVLIYTPMKSVSPVALLIGAVPGAMPPVIGFAALAGRLDTAAWLLFLIMFVWQVPHFLAIAWLYRDDYAKAGLPMLPVIDPDGSRTFRQMLIGCLTLVPLGLLPTLMGVSGRVYFVVALICGLGFLGVALAMVRSPSHRRARGMFIASLVYLPVVLICMLINQVG